VLLARLTLLTLLLPAVAWAQRASTEEALARVEETLHARLGESTLSLEETVPVIVVSVAPAFEETRAWYPNAALATLVHLFGAASVRSCEACSVARLYADTGRLEQNSAGLDVAEIARLDQSVRGAAAPARAAIWLDENAQGVSLRIVDLKNSHLLVAENFDAAMTEPARTRKNVSLAMDLDRRARGDSLAHVFFDATLYPAQHLSFDFVEQWGATNANLSGVSLSLFDPVLGIGGAYYRVLPQALNITVGAKVLMSLPTALVKSIARGSDNGTDLIDPLLTGVFIVRVPISTSNYAVTLSASTNGRVGFGFSLLNFSVLPFLP
jgi:hypothetical protein